MKRTQPTAATLATLLAAGCGGNHAANVESFVNNLDAFVRATAADCKTESAKETLGTDFAGSFPVDANKAMEILKQKSESPEFKAQLKTLETSFQKLSPRQKEDAAEASRNLLQTDTYQQDPLKTHILQSMISGNSLGRGVPR